MNTEIKVQQSIANPFPGLRPFRIDESHLFFGREGQTDEVLMKLSQHRFVGIIGPSGSGKSSFVYCGVLPILYGGFLANAGPNWEVVVTRPGNSPINYLAEAILEKDISYHVADTDDKRTKRTIMSALIKSSSLGLVEAIEQTGRGTDKNFLILVDQFEELFRFKDNRSQTDTLNESLAFVNLLMEAVNYQDKQIYVAITMRSDFIGECAQFADLTRKLNDSHYLIPQLTREQKKLAIEGPVAVGGGQIASTLTQKLLNDLGDNPDQLPILQHALMRTWSFWSVNKESDEPMDLKHYEAIGTMSEALSQHANEAYDELSEHQREICAILFKAITEKRGESFGIRRPTILGEIAAIADVGVAEVAAVIDKFREPGRSLLVPQYPIPLDAGSMIDISHESLMRIWVRLKNWVDDEAESINMYLRLSEAAALHQIGKGALWRPPDLQLALNWQIKSRPTLVWGQRYDPAYERTMVFLEYSKKAFEEEQKIKELQAKRALQRARTTALVMAAAAVVSIGFLIYAFAKKTEADKNFQIAEVQKAEALKNKDLADQEAERANEQAYLADSSARVAKFQEAQANLNARAAKLAEDSAKLARDQAFLAKQQAEASQLEAERQEGIAKKNERLAEENADLARREERHAQILRFQSLSKALALNATKNIPDAQLKGLLARQGYNFNKNFEGPNFNADVYAGLYEALSYFNDKSTNSLQGHKQQVNIMIAGAGNEKIMYSGDSEGKILKWTLNNLENIYSEVIVPESNGSHVINDMVLSNNGRWLIAGGDFPDKEDGTTYVRLVNLTNNRVEDIYGFTDNVINLEFMKDGNSFIALDDGGRSIVTADINTKMVLPLITPSQRITHITFSNTADANILAGAGIDGKIHFWDLANNFREESVDLPGGQQTKLTSVQFSPDARYLVVGDLEGGVSLMDMQTRQRIRKFTGNTAKIDDIEFSSNGKYMAVASYNKTVRIWNMENLNDQPIVLEFDSWASGLSFSTNSEYLFSGGFEGGEVKVFPMDFTSMAERLCRHINRDLTEEEWRIYIAELDDIPFESTCGYDQ
jgi:WD40 repeat protein/energy-coupling factor transporter ATP-binding protein EcfA2